MVYPNITKTDIKKMNEIEMIYKLLYAIRFPDYQDRNKIDAWRVKVAIAKACEKIHKPEFVGLFEIDIQSKR